MICLTFTFPRDFRRAAVHARFLPHDWRRIWCVAPEDAEAARSAAPAGTEILPRAFPRGRTLIGGGAVDGMRDVFLELAERPECDLLVKLDSDTALFLPEAWTAPHAAAGADFTYIRRHGWESRMPLANGCCYAVSRRAMRRLKNFYVPPPAFEGREDFVFSAFWTGALVPENRDLSTCRLDKNKFWWCARPYDGADCFGAHFGYVAEDVDFALCAARLSVLEN